MNKMNNKILLVIPTLNEFGNIQKIYKKIQTVSKKINILFIDDNSIDGSKKILIKHAPTIKDSAITNEPGNA